MSNSAIFHEYINKFSEYAQYDEMYFVVHTPAGNLQEVSQGKKNIHLMDLDRIAELVIHAGLINWLITKRS